MARTLWPGFGLADHSPSLEKIFRIVQCAGPIEELARIDPRFRDIQVTSETLGLPAWGCRAELEVLQLSGRTAEPRFSSTYECAADEFAARATIHKSSKNKDLSIQMYNGLLKWGGDYATKHQTRIITKGILHASAIYPQAGDLLIEYSSMVRNSNFSPFEALVMADVEAYLWLKNGNLMKACDAIESAATDEGPVSEHAALIRSLCSIAMGDETDALQRITGLPDPNRHHNPRPVFRVRFIGQALQLQLTRRAK